MSFETDDGIRVFTRDDWGARPPKGNYSALGQRQSTVIHHGGPVGAPRATFAHAKQTCQSWQGYHMDHNGWSDIGYHYLMDALGRLYEGRPTWAMGAHVLGQNSNRVGINLMQDGRTWGMTEEQYQTMDKLFRVGHEKLELPSLKSQANHDGDRWGVYGHREVPGQSTECPGGKILEDLHRLIRKYT